MTIIIRNVFKLEFLKLTKVVEVLKQNWYTIFVRKSKEKHEEGS